MGKSTTDWRYIFKKKKSHEWFLGIWFVKLSEWQHYWWTNNPRRAVALRRVSCSSILPTNSVNSFSSVFFWILLAQDCRLENAGPLVITTDYSFFKGSDCTKTEGIHDMEIPEYMILKQFRSATAMLVNCLQSSQLYGVVKTSQRL